MSHPDHSSSRTTLDRALQASATGDSALAMRLFMQAIDEQPSSPDAYFLLGSECAATGDMALAEQHFSTALLLHPQWHVVRYQLGLLQFSDGRLPAALLTWQSLAGLEAGSPLPHWIRGFAALAQDEFASARQSFELGLACNQDNPAMSGDILRILAALPEQASALESSASLEEDVSHVLLSNYQQAGPAH